jgi:hypothetical protein
MKGAYYWASLVHAGNLMLKGALAQSEELSRTVEQQAKTFGLYEIWTAAQQNLFYLYLLSRQHDKLDSLIDSILDWGQKSGSPWMLIKAPILSLAYTQESEGVKNQRLLESKRLIATLETNAQNEELRSSFEKARATWLKGF